MSFKQTHCSQLHDLLETFDSHLAGKASQDDVLKKLFEFQRLRRSLKFFFNRFSEYEEKAVLRSEAVEEAGKALEGLKPQLLRFESSLRKGDGPEARERLRSIGGLTEKLFDSLDKLKQSKEAEIRFSKIPMVHEIVRLGKAFQKGNFPLKKFQEVVQKSLDYHGAYYSHFKQVIKKDAESYKPFSEILRKNLKSIEDCLRQIQEELKKGKLASKALHELAAYADDLHETLQKLEEREKSRDCVTCVHCGHSNPPALRFCQKCNASLPRMAADSGHVLDLKLEDQGVKPGSSYVMTSATEELKKRIDLFLKTGSGKTSLKNYLQLFLEKSKAAAAAIMKFSVPKELRDQDEQQGFQDFRKQILDNLEAFQEGLSLIVSGLEENHPEKVHAACEQVLSSGSALASVQKLLG